MDTEAEFTGYLEICLGHIASRRLKENNGIIPSYICPECTLDEKNVDCPDYKPIVIKLYNVIGEEEQL